jgi:predicted RNA-binding protein
VKLGGKFTLILTASGKVYFHGEITQEGNIVTESYEEMICLNDRMGDKDKFVPEFAKDFMKLQGKEIEKDEF